MTGLNLKNALGAGDLDSVIKYVNSQEFNALDENVYFKYIDEIAEMLDDLPSLAREDVFSSTNNAASSNDANEDQQLYQIHQMRSVVVTLLVNVVNNVREPDLWAERASDVGRLLVESLDMLKELPTLSSTLWNIWLADRAHTERALLEFGLMSPLPTIRLASIQELSRWVKEMNGRIAFRKFTFAVVRLLQDSNEAISRAAYALLVQFFSSAKPAAKDDLFSIVQRLQLPRSIATQLEQGISNGSIEAERSEKPQSITPEKITPEKELPLTRGPLVANDKVPKMRDISPQSIPRSKQSFAPSYARGESRTPSPAASKPVVIEPVEAQKVDIPGQNSTPNVAENPTFDFLKDNQYPMQPVDTPKNPPYSLEQAYTELQPLLRFFNGKETEDNWTMRMNAVKLLRYMVRMASSPPSQQELYILREAFRIMQRGLGETVLTMRTVLAAETCQCIKDFVQLLSKSQHFLDLFQPLLDPIVKTAMGVKKITAHAANLTLCAIFYETSVVSPRMFALIERESKSTKAQARAYSYVWLAVSILLCHSSLTGKRGEIVNMVSKAVGDATPMGRTRGRELYWACSVAFPEIVSEIDRKISPSARRALENNIGAVPSVPKRVSPMKSQPMMRPNTKPIVSPIRPVSQPSIHRSVNRDISSNSQKAYQLRLSQNPGNDMKPPKAQLPTTSQKPLKLSSMSSPMRPRMAQPNTTLPRLASPASKITAQPAQSTKEDEIMDLNATDSVYLDHSASTEEDYNNSDKSIEFEDEIRSDEYRGDSSSQSGEVVQSMADLSMEEDRVPSDDESPSEESPKNFNERLSFIRQGDGAISSSSPLAKRTIHDSTPLRISTKALEQNDSPIYQSQHSINSINDSFDASNSASDSISTENSHSQSKITPDSSGASENVAENYSKVESSSNLPRLHQQRPRALPTEQLPQPRISSDDICPFPESPSMCKAKINSILESIRTNAASAEDLAALAVLIAASSVRSQSKNSPLHTAATQWAKSYQYDMELRDSIIPYIENTSSKGNVQNTSVALILLRCLLNTPPDASYKDVYLQPSDCLNCLFRVAQEIAPKSLEVADHLLPDIGQLLLSDHRLADDTLVEILFSQFTGRSSSSQKVLAITILKRALTTHVAILEDASDSVVQLILESLSDDDVSVRKDAYPVLALIHQANSAVSERASSQMNEGQRYLLNHYLNCV